jgi:hypothetical protein
MERKSPSKKKSGSRSPRSSSPKSSKNHKYFITPTLAFIYQVLNVQKSDKDLVLNYLTTVEQSRLITEYFDMIEKTKFSLKFSYQDAIECSTKIDSPKWEIVEKFMNLFEKYDNYSFNGVDVPFLMELFKKEATELQKGNLTFIHSKSVGFFVLDVISKMITGSYEGYRQKCQRDENNPNEKALEIYNKLNFDPYYPGYIFSTYEELMESDKLSDTWNDKNNRRNDNNSDIRSRVISCNINILNNAFNTGESTLQFLFDDGGIGFPTRLINDLGLSKESTKKINLLSMDMYKIATNMLDIFSIPINKLDKYVYLAQAYGYKDTKNPDNIYEFFDIYLGETPWKGKFIDMYISQVRIIDLCLNKYGYKDGVRVYQMIDIDDNQLNVYLKKIEDIVMKENELLEKIKGRTDQPVKTKSNPFKKIKTVKRTLQKDLDASLLLKYLIDTNTEERIPEIENIVLEEALNSGGYQKGYHKKLKTEELFYTINEYANKVIKGRWKEAEKMLLELNPENSGRLIREYIRNVLSKYPGRWKQYEDFISKIDILDSSEYLEVLKKLPERWLDLEEYFLIQKKEYENVIQGAELAKQARIDAVKKEKEAENLLWSFQSKQHRIERLKEEYNKILSYFQK